MVSVVKVNLGKTKWMLWLKQMYLDILKGKKKYYLHRKKQKQKTHLNLNLAASNGSFTQSSFALFSRGSVNWSLLNQSWTDERSVFSHPCLFSLCVDSHSGHRWTCNLCLFITDYLQSITFWSGKNRKVYSPFLEVGGCKRTQVCLH